MYPQLRGALTCCAVDWLLAVVPLSYCVFEVDWEGAGLPRVIHLLLHRGLVGSVGGLVGPVGGLVGRQAVMQTPRMRLWWDAVVLQGLGVIEEGLGPPLLR